MQVLERDQFALLEYLVFMNQGPRIVDASPWAKHQGRKNEKMDQTQDCVGQIG